MRKGMARVTTSSMPDAAAAGDRMRTLKPGLLWKALMSYCRLIVLLAKAAVSPLMTSELVPEKWTPRSLVVSLRGGV
jgi:hypothetical protein